MKILEINKFYFLKGGSERYLFSLSKILKSKGHEVSVFSMKGENNLSSEYQDYFIDYVPLDRFSIKNIFKFFYNYDAVKKLKKLIRDERPDIAHLHNVAHQFSPAIIAVLKKNNIPIVQTLHDYKLICPNAMLYANRKICEQCRGQEYYHCLANRCMKNSRAKSLMGMLEAYLYNRFLKIYDQVDAFIAPSRFMKDKCASFGIRPEKIKVIYNFLDFKEYENPQADKAQNYILYYGRLSEEKGVETVLKALQSAKSDIAFKIVGSGPDYKSLSEQIISLNLSEKAELLGPKYGAELKNIINQAKAVILPSMWPENMPYCLLESMASKKAVIAARSGGMPELIKNQENGFLFTAGDYKNLADIIDNLANFNLDEIGKKARKSIEHLNPNNHYKQMINLFQEVIWQKKHKD